MQALIVLALCLISPALSQHAAFCYHEASCGPTSHEWPGVCQSGARQSPIVLPPMTLSTQSATVKISQYQHSSFRIINTGHSVQVDFNGKPIKVTLPDPTLSIGMRTYTFASAHFHWGDADRAVGSEHCIGVKCANMEMHLVHYLSSYPSQAAAVASGDPNALAVIGVLIDYTLGEMAAPVSLVGLLKPTGVGGTGPLAPIVNNLNNVAEADESGKWVTVNQPLDLTKLLYQTGIPGVSMELFTYKGSLTTPGCNENVNWYVMKSPARTSKYNLNQFRSIIRDGSGRVLTKNNRPTQNLNGRVVKKFKVLS